MILKEVSFMIKKGLSIFIILICLIIIFIVIISINSDIKLNTQLEILLGPAKEYLKAKYFENMIIVEEKITYYDSIYTIYAYPQNNEDVQFTVRYLENDSIFIDDYFERYSEWEAATIIDSILSNFVSNHGCRTVMYFTDNLKDELYAYNNLNGRPLSWYDEQHFDSLSYVHIEIYDSNDTIEEENFIEPALSSIENLNFLIERVKIEIYKNVGDSEPLKEYNYKLNQDNLLEYEQPK